MSRALAISLGQPGHLFPFMPILLELQRRGHETTVALSGAAGGPPTAMLASIPIVTIDHAIDDAAEIARTGGDESAIIARFGTPVVNAVRAFIESHQPDILLVDPFLWGAMLAAKMTGLPWVSVASTPLAFCGTGLDVRGPGLPPARGLPSRARHYFAAMQNARKNRLKLDVINSCRRIAGQRSLARVEDLLLEPTMILATTVEPFEYPRSDWPDNLRFVGPMLWEPPPPAGWQLKVPADGLPIVMLVGSSIPDPPGTPSWTDDVLRALAKQPVFVVATIPTGDLPLIPPRNAFVTRLLPHLQVLKSATCLVCHGAPGIVDKALSCGVPVISIPYGIDRYEVARRVQLAGAGVSLSVRRLSSRAIRNALHKVATDDVRSAARRIASQFAAAGGAASAADAIESCIT